MKTKQVKELAAGELFHLNHVGRIYQALKVDRLGDHTAIIQYQNLVGTQKHTTLVSEFKKVYIVK